MKWSVSTTKLFQICPRKYYYQQILAKKNSDDPRAREAYALKQLRNLYTWRGNLVDGVISRYIVPKINKKEVVDEGIVIAHAKDLMRKELDWLKAKVDDKSVSDKQNQDSNLGFFESEYGIEINKELICRVEDEIVTSLKNLLNSTLFSDIVKDQSYLVAQRRLQFSLGNLKISCTPDLIVFPKKDSPKIIDWKVESVFREHWLQLGIYGFALSKIAPHKDFPVKWQDFIRNPRNIELIEFQLLRNKDQRYRITNDDLVDIEDHIHVSSNEIAKLLGDNEIIDINQFPTARSPETCQKCQYRKMCWRELGYDSI